MEDIAAAFSERTFRTLGNHSDLFVIPKRVDASESVSPAYELPDDNELNNILQRNNDPQSRQWRWIFEDHSEIFFRTTGNGSSRPRPVSLPRIRSFLWNASSFSSAGLLKTGEALPCGLANYGGDLQLNSELLAYWNRVLGGLDLAQEIPRTKADWLYSALEAQVPGSSLDDSNLRFPFTDLLLLDHFPLDRSIRNRQFYIAMMLPAIYGGIHLAASTFDFPSVIESRLWLYSGLYIAIGLPIWEVMAWLMVIYGATGVTDTLLSCLGCSNTRVHKWFWTSMRSVLGRVFLFLYTLARLYIIVESFVSLRHVPIGVYLTPSWVQMIPHL